MSATYLHVKNWDELQHYTKRNPPWIKLYRRLLKEGDFQELTEAQQWQLVRIWLVSAEEHPGGWVLGTQSYLRRMTGSVRHIPVQLFIDKGWLTSHSAAEYASASASTHASNFASTLLEEPSALLDTEKQRTTNKEPRPNPEPEANQGEAGNGQGSAGEISTVREEARRILATVKAQL